MARELHFESPSFAKRLKGMLGVDFYRLVSAMTMMSGPDGSAATPLYSNVWQIIAASEPLYVINSIADYANMNMVFIFGGIMVSIFIGHDYKSGYVKQLFTTHAKKQDYMMSKSIVCAFAMACMCVTYFIGGTVGGLLVGYDTAVNVGSLILAILGKMVMSLGWASLYTFLNIIFRRYFGVSIASSFFFGTGILIIGVAAVVENLSIPTFFLNIFLYGSSVNACLVSNIGTLLLCVIVSVAWAVIYNMLGTEILSKCDVY